MELPGLATEQANQNNSNASTEIENLLSLVYKNDSYHIFHNQSVEADYSYKNHLKMAWLVVKYNQDWLPPHEENVYYVEKGDIIKFGRVRFKIRELKINRSAEGESEEDAVTHHVNVLDQGLGASQRHGEETITYDNNADAGLSATRTIVPAQLGQANHPEFASQRSLVSEAYTNIDVNDLARDTEENLAFNRARGDASTIDVNVEESVNKELKRKYATLQPGTAKEAPEEVICRICLSEDEPGNPIISPCKCIGSVRYIHLKCVQEWLESKKHKKETPYVNSYIWRGLECEICKT